MEEIEKFCPTVKDKLSHLKGTNEFLWENSDFEKTDLDWNNGNVLSDSSPSLTRLRPREATRMPRAIEMVAGLSLLAVASTSTDTRTECCMARRWSFTPMD